VSVDRLTYPALKKIVAGKVRNDATCVLKFYSNGCHMCHNLKEYYEDMSNNKEYENIHFYAFNIDTYPDIQADLGFNGVPTIAMINTYKNRRLPQIKILADPNDPSDATFYKMRDIKSFIDENRDDA